MEYEPRLYRQDMAASDLVSFVVVNAETDLHIAAVRDLTAEAGDLVAALRADLEAYIASHPRFAESYVPVDVEPGAPEIVRAMVQGAEVAGVGPMAAVAGAVAERVARGLADHSSDVIVENGGDIFLMGARDRIIAVWAGDSPFTGTLGLRVPAAALPIAVCTSSGRIGHSTSFGRADTATVLAADAALADAAATRLANIVRDASDIERALDAGRRMPGVSGILITVGERIGAWGTVELVPVGE